MIKVTDLSKVFRTEEIETTALDKVSFEIKDGEFVAIMGPSGTPRKAATNSRVLKYQGSRKGSAPDSAKGTSGSYSRVST